MLVLDKLSSWSWQDIQRSYRILGAQLQEYKNTADRFEIELPLVPRPGEVIKYAGGEEIFVTKFYKGVCRINSYLEVLDIEISRRNQLIGVIG